MYIFSDIHKFLSGQVRNSRNNLFFGLGQDGKRLKRRLLYSLEIHGIIAAFMEAIMTFKQMILLYLIAFAVFFVIDIIWPT
jgi:hypothetical protein